MTVLADGSIVLLKGKKREFLVEVSEGELHTDLGIIQLKELREMRQGDSVTTHLGHDFVIQKPRTIDFFRHCKRVGAPMIPKDIGIIIAYTGLSKEDEVLDAGTGSGILAIYLGSIASKVITYERNAEFAKIARKNICATGLKNVEVRHGDILSEAPQLKEKFDVITLDMMDASQMIPFIKNMLKPGGFLVTYSPFFEQSKDIREAMGKEFSEVRTLECMERDINFAKGRTRPSTRAIGHTGFITIARL
ncbi:MAG: tRNA (adenine-N1)-methyltransferase [Methanocellales archaeon]|nr:tRNA (adenine-N1)-methyltransferase [Methanocellales archaeon]MDD5447065.1 tRNA (adenine-N1)-methyltransferase [Methanocellales archaeon]